MTRLTKRTVTAAKSGEKLKIIWDAELKGFGLQILPSGTKSFVVQYRNSYGRTRRTTIGRFGALTPDQARKAAQGILHKVACDEDPATDKQEMRSAPSVSVLLDRYLSEHLDRKNAKSTRIEFRRLVEKHIRPRLGSMKAASVTANDVSKLHRSMADTPRQANVVLSIISKIFNLAEVWGLRPRHSNPVFGIERYAETERERFLSSSELGRLGATLIEAETKGLPWIVKSPQSKHLRKDAEQRRTAIDPIAIAAIRLLLLTGARLSEVLTLRWEHVDLEAETIELPSRKGGGRKTHPANSPTLEVLRDLARKNPSHWVFPRSKDPSRHLSKEVLENAWQRIRWRADITDVRIHDLRHTVGTFAGQAGGNAFVVRDLLRHKGIAMTERYVNRDADPVRELSDAVGDRISANLRSGLKGAEIIPLRRDK